MNSIFHLSFPVGDLDEAIAFYRETFGAIVGRRETDWADMALFGAQITLQQAPADLSDAMPRTRHFGATLPWEEWQDFTDRHADYVEPPTTRFHDTERQQAKAMIRDPSGNLIEIKAYRKPSSVLPGGLVTPR